MHACRDAAAGLSGGTRAPDGGGGGGAFVPMLARGLRLAWRRRLDSVAALMFFVLVGSLFPLALSALRPGGMALAALAPAVLWIAALLAVTLGSLRLFADDAANGVLEQVLLGPGGAGGALAGLMLAHWLAVALPLLVATPLVALSFGLPASRLAPLLASLLLGTPVLCLLSALGAALTLGARAGGLLLALLVLPWCVPVLLFGLGAAQGDPLGGGWNAGAFLLLGAMLAAGLALGVPALRAALELGVE